MEQKTPIEWICPEGDPEAILASLVKRYEQEAKSSKIPADSRRCIYRDFTCAYGSFQKGFRYRLGILENRHWHGKDIYIKGSSHDDPKNSLFSIILIFLSETQPIEILENG